MALGKFANRIVGSGEEPLDQIQFNPRNWRVHPLNQQNALKGVLEEVGWVQEVIVNKRTGNLIDGHLRCQLAAREGAKTIPVKYVDLSEDEEALVLSALDPIAAMAVTDKAKLDDLFASIETENADVLKMLDDIAEKERLEYAKRDPVDAEPQIDRAAELNEKWQVVTGDLWQIGEHRLLCGDSTKREDVERVMGGEKADMCFTSPPYNAGISAKLRGNTSIDDNLYRDEYDDNKTQTDYFDLLVGFTNNALEYSKYVFVNIQVLSGNKKAFIDYWSNFSDKFCDVAIWDKCHAAPAMAQRVMDSRFEFVLVFGGNGSRAIGTRDFRGMVHNVYSGNPQRHNDNASVHAATFPIDFPEYFINNFTNKDEIVLDPFLGTGTTMVACENLHRKCRGIEISPNYCAVILERMATAFPELEIKKVD